MSCSLSAHEALSHCYYLINHYPSFILRLDDGTYSDPSEKASAIFRMILMLTNKAQLSEAREVFEFAAHIDTWTPNMQVKYPSIINSIAKMSQSMIETQSKSMSQNEESGSSSGDSCSDNDYR